MDCATCLATVPTPTPTPVTYIYREYEDCEDSTTKQIFRLEDGIGVTFPGFVKYNNICYHNPVTTGSTSTIDVPSLQYASCSECLGTLPPDPPLPPPTPTYYYWSVQECSGTNVIQVRTTDPDVGSTKISIEFGGVCYEVQSAGSVNTNDITAAFADCATCAGTTPTPVYYSIESCINGSIFRTGQETSAITLNVNDRVQDASLVNYKVLGTTTTGTSVGNVTNTGLTGCPTSPVPSPQLWYRLKSCGSHPDCWYQAPQAPTFDQRFVDSASSINYFYRYDGDAGQTYSQGNCNVQPVGSPPTTSGCPPAPTPPQPPPQPPPTPSTTDVEIVECGTTSPTYNVTVNFFVQSTGVAFKITGSGSGCGTTFDGSRCWEVTAIGGTSYCNVTTTEIGICGTLTNCAPTPTPPTPTPPTPPPTIYGQYLDCDGNDNVTYVSAPSGTTFPAVLKISGICYEYSGLGGSSGPLYSNYDDFASCSLCEATVPSPPPPSPPTPTCFAINNMSTGSSATLACNPFRFETMYFNNSSFCQASNFFRTDANCSTQPADTYVSNGTYYRYWSNGQFGSCQICQQQ